MEEKGKDRGTNLFMPLKLMSTRISCGGDANDKGERPEEPKPN